MFFDVVRDEKILGNVAKDIMVFNCQNVANLMHSLDCNKRHEKFNVIHNHSYLNTFKNLWIEWGVKDDPIIKYGVLVSKKDNNVELSTFSVNSKNFPYYLGSIVISLDENEKTNENSKFDCILSYHGKKIKESVLRGKVDYLNFPDLFDNVFGDMSVILLFNEQAVIWSFLKLLNCKNIKIIDHEVEIPVKKKKRRPNNIKIFHTLELPSENDEYKGYFRTYTEDKPLFGKITGTFFVPL